MNHFSRELRGIGDEGKEICHLEEAANGGHHVRECHENKNDNVERAVKHWIIAATQGQNESIKSLMDAFKERME